MTWKKLMIGLSEFQPWSKQTSTGSHFQSQIKDIDSATFSFQQCFSNLFSKTPGCHIRFQIKIWKHLNTVLAKVNKAVGLLHKLRNKLPITKDNANYYIQSFHSATPGLWWCPVLSSL